MKNIAVFFGGSSVEHDISVITGVLTANSLDKEKFNPLPVYVDYDGKWYTGEKLLDLDGYRKLDVSSLTRVTLFNGDNTLYRLKNNKKIKPLSKISVAINCLHGERGEDGSLSGLLCLSEIPLASPSVLPSAISMDKSFTKIVLKGLKVKTLPSVTVSSANDLDKISSKLKFPLIVKPACLGSSIGIVRADDKTSLKDGILNGLRFGEKVIIEPFLQGAMEINCSAYLHNDKVVVSECERPVGGGGMLTFNDKYRGGKRVFPADVEKQVSDKIKEITKTVYQGLCFSGVIRIDYFVKDSQIYLNEINSVPGSLAFYLFSDTLKGFSVMLEKLIAQAELEQARRSTFKRRFDSGVLLDGGCKGAKKQKKKS